MEIPSQSIFYLVAKSKLTDWEQDFLKNMRREAASKHMTPRQLEVTWKIINKYIEVPCGFDERIKNGNAALLRGLDDSDLDRIF